MGADTGGGWINGRGDSTMMMLEGYSRIVRFFNSLEWWKTEPHDELVNNGAFCLAEAGRLYIIYLPKGGNVTVRAKPVKYEVKWFNPRTGVFSGYSVVNGPTWTSPSAPDRSDWVILMKSI